MPLASMLTEQLHDTVAIMEARPCSWLLVDLLEILRGQYSNLFKLHQPVASVAVSTLEGISRWFTKKCRPTRNQRKPPRGRAINRTCEDNTHDE